MAVRAKDPEAKRREVQHLVRCSEPMLGQDWMDFRIKDTDAGAMVWEAKAVPFWMKREGKAVEPRG